MMQGLRYGGVALCLSASACSGGRAHPPILIDGADGGGNVGDDANDAGGGNLTAYGTPPSGACGSNAWTTYGHDSARTFASDACIDGPLTVAWSYAPTPPAMKTIIGVDHAIADANGVYLQWAASDGMYLGDPSADRISLQGKAVWSFDSQTDFAIAGWATLNGNTLVINDDGVYEVDVTTGKMAATTGVDWWGQTIAAPNGGVWYSDTDKADGPGLSVGLLDATAKTVWKQNEQGTMCGQGLADQTGGLALDGSTLFYAPDYSTQSSTMPLPSGVYAFDPTTGAKKWTVASTPKSAVSAANGLVYLMENGALVARKQSDGSVAWAQSVANAGVQAPVIVNGLAIVATQSNVRSFDALTGTTAWTTKMSGANAVSFFGDSQNMCAGPALIGTPAPTKLAAAASNGTLVVTAADGIHLLDIATGRDKWSGTVAGATGPVHDPIIVGKTVYVIDSPVSRATVFGPGKLFALTAM
jgi:hypothetical protein